MSNIGKVLDELELSTEMDHMHNVDGKELGMPTCKKLSASDLPVMVNTGTSPPCMCK